VIGWENIELISDRPLEVMLDDFARLKAEFPDRCPPEMSPGIGLSRPVVVTGCRGIDDAP